MNEASEFRVVGGSGDGKRVFIEGMNLQIEVNRDDTDTKGVDRCIPILIDILNAHWPEDEKGPKW